MPGVLRSGGYYREGAPRGVLVRRRPNPVLRFFWGSKWTLTAGVAGTLLIGLPLPMWGRAAGFVLLAVIMLLWAAWPAIQRRRRKADAIRIVSRAGGVRVRSSGR